MGKNRKRVLIVISCLFVFILSIIFYPRKDDSKSIIKKSYAINIKNDGETSYTSVANLPSDLTNYHIDDDKTICENGGKVSIVGNKLAYQTLGSDRCTVYLYYEKPSDLIINLLYPDNSQGMGIIRTPQTCNGISGLSWSDKLNGVEIANISKDGSTTPSCNIGYKLITLPSLESTVNESATRDENGKRYEGKNPDNYIWFNDELWRIIGNIPVCLTSGCSSTENRVKIIRNDSIGALVYNQFKYSSSSRLAWIGSSIQRLLNTCYLGKTSSCFYCYSYSYSSLIKGTCDYSSDGIDANDYYGKMIEDVYFNIGIPLSGSYVNANDQYEKEIASYATTASKIGLMYASDWGYAIEDYTEVLGSSGNSWDFSDKNWLFSNGDEWTMSAYSSSYPMSVSSLSYLSNENAYYGNAIRPVLYLKSDVYVVSGTGTKVDPYRIGM